MTRDDMLEKLDAAGVDFDRRLGEKKLAALVEELADEPVGMVPVRCNVANVWTNGEPRKLMLGDIGAVPASDLETLGDKVTRL